VRAERILLEGSSMKLRYGNYTHPIGEAGVKIARSAIYNDAGIPFAIRETWTIDGMILANSQAAIGTAIAALEAAYASDGRDVALLFDDGTPTEHAIANSATLGGVRVVQPPSFPHGVGAEYSTYRTYQIVLDAQVLNASGLLSFDESISFTGGGSRVGFVETLQGPPQKQTLVQQTSYRAAQSGRAVGLLGYPIVPNPIWPKDEHTDQRRIDRRAPRRRGGFNSILFTEYEVTWSYTFESAKPLNGLPNIWHAGRV